MTHRDRRDIAMREAKSICKDGYSVDDAAQIIKLETLQIQELSSWCENWLDDPPVREGGMEAMNPIFSEITELHANRIFDILVKECRASRASREQFNIYMIGRPTTGSSGEFRFQGNLGFGGKFYLRANGEAYVSCYSEDRTPARNKAIARAMRGLESLSKQLID